MPVRTFPSVQVVAFADKLDDDNETFDISLVRVQKSAAKWRTKPYLNFVVEGGDKFLDNSNEMLDDFFAPIPKQCRDVDDDKFEVRLLRNPFVHVVLGCVGREQCDYFRHVMGFHRVVDLAFRWSERKRRRVEGATTTNDGGINHPGSLVKAWKWTDWVLREQRRRRHLEESDESSTSSSHHSSGNNSSSGAEEEEEASSLFDSSFFSSYFTDTSDSYSSESDDAFRSSSSSSSNSGSSSYTDDE